jgi:phage-related tail protein
MSAKAMSTAVEILKPLLSADDAKAAGKVAMGMMKTTIDALVEAGYRDKVKVIIGGAPVNQKYADEIGADGYAADAGSASKLAKFLVYPVLKFDF